MSEKTWMDEAVCLSVDPEVFFPIATRKGTNVRRQQVKQATDVCAKCTVADECFSYAKTLGIRDGIWGGFDFEDPRVFRKIRQNA